MRYLTGAVPNFLLPEPITKAPPTPGPKGHSDLSYHFRVEPGVLSKQQGQPPSPNPFVESLPAEEDRSEKWFAMEGEPARPGLQTLEWRPGDRKEHIAELRDLLERQEWAPHELGQRQQLEAMLRGAEAKRDEPKSMLQTAEMRSGTQTKVQRPEDMAVPAVDRRNGVAKPLVSPAVAEPLGAGAKSDTPVPGTVETPPANAMEPKPLPPPVLTGDLADPLPELPRTKGDRSFMETKLRESEARARELLLPLLRKRVGLGFDASLVGEMLNTILDIEANFYGVGDLVAPADAKKTEAEALQKRLENLEQQGGLSAGDVNELFTSNKQGKELAEYILQLRGAIKRDDQANETAQKMVQQQEAAQRDAEQLEMSPQAWAQQHQMQLGQLKGPELEAYLQQTQAAYDRRVQGINEGYETLNKQMRALDEEGQALIAENEDRLAKDDFPPGRGVHPDLEGRFQSHNARLWKWQQEATATQAKLMGEEELVKTQGEQLQAGFDRYATQAKEIRQGELAQLRQQPLPGAGLAADEYQELETQVDSRRAALKQQVRDGSLSPQEAQSAGAALDEELRTGRQAVQQRLTERLEKTAVTLQALTKEKDPEAARAAAVEKLAAEVKLTPEQAETLLADLEARDWTRYLPSQGEKEPGLADVLSQDSRRVRVLSTGAVVVNPALAANPEEYIAAVKSAPATEEAKQAALARMQEARREWVRGVADQLHAESRIPGLPSYMEWMQEQQQRDQAEQGGRGFLKLSEEDRLLRYVDTMRKRPEWEKYADTSLRSLFSGGGAVGASLVGVAGMAVDLSPAGIIMKRLGINAGEEISEVAKKWDESNQAITAGLQAKGGLDTLGLKGASILASVVPQAGAMFMGGAVVKGSKLAMGLLEAAQSAGQVYVERYGELRRQGMSHADAWKQAAPHALGAGLTTGVISLVVGKAGEEGLKKLGQALTTPAMRQVLKEGLGEQMVRVAGMTKEAALQFAEEMADNLGQNVLAKEAKGEKVDIMQIVTETLQQSPETLTSVIGMMGVTKGAGGSKHSIGGTPESVPRLDASSVAGYASGGGSSSQGKIANVVPPVSFSGVQTQAGLPLATSQPGPAPVQAPGQPNQSSTAEVANPPNPVNPTGQSGPAGSVPPPLPQAGVQPGAAPPTQPGQAPSTLAQGNPSGGTPQPVSYTPPTPGTDPQGNPLSARGESAHSLSENNEKQQQPMENGGTPATQVPNPEAPHLPPTDQPGTPTVNTPPTQVPNQEAPHLPPTDPSGKPVVNTPPTQVPNQEAPHQPRTDQSGVPAVNAPPVRPPDVPPPIWQGTARHGDYAEVLSRNPNGTFQVRIRGQEQTRTERDVAYMTGMNKPALDAHLDGATQTHLTRGQTPSGPPIWQGTARHGDYAEVLSRNPNGTFQVRIRGQEQTRTERDVAYMTGMNKPALDAHLEGVMAGRKGVGQSPRVESDSAQVVDQTTVRTPTGPHGPLRQLMDQVTQILERLFPGLIGRDVHLLTSAEDLLNSDYARQRERPFTADEVAAIQQSEGFHDPLTGQSFVFAGQVISKPWESQRQAVLRVMLHEAIGHGGVNRLLAGNEKARRNFDHLVGKIMELDPEGFQALAADPAYAHLKGDTRALALEWLAQKSETRPDLLRKPNLLTHLRNVLGQAISDLQVKLGLRPETGADLDRRVDIFLHQARQAAMRGGVVDPNFAGRGELQLSNSDKSRPDYSPVYILFNKTHNNSRPVPKGRGPNGGRLQSHHGLQQEWCLHNLLKYGYDPKLAPTITLETGVNFPHTAISKSQNSRRNARLQSGTAKWGSTLQEELQYLVHDLTLAGFERGHIQEVLNQQYRMLQKLDIPFQKIQY